MRKVGLPLLAVAVLPGCAAVDQYAIAGSVSTPSDAAYDCILGHLTKAG